MSNKITLVGAGSTIFALTLLKDLCAFDTITDTNVTLYDIDPQRLATTNAATAHLIAQQPASRALSVTATQSLDEALRGADFVVIMFQIGGYEPATVIDFDIPKRYGLRQTIADTLGIGGIMRGLRTIPVLLEITQAMRSLCPNALLMNYANPMAINCWGLQAAGVEVPFVGLCHSIPITTEQLAEDLQIPADEITYLVAGINHLAFYLKLEHNGADLYPRLREFMKSDRFPPRRACSSTDMVDHLRYELFSRTGYFVTESSEHLSEYLPWFIKNSHPDLISRYNIPLDEYPRRCREQIAEWKELQHTLESPNAGADIPALRSERSNDYGMQIIDSIITNTPRRVYCNVPNNGALISNLPHQAIVEVPCLVDGTGVHPVTVGPLPPHLAAIMRTNTNTQELTALAAVERRRDYVYHAASLDPHTAAELPLDTIYAMVDDLLRAHGDYIKL